MDYYHLWFNLKDPSRDLPFCRSVADYFGYLKEQRLIEGFRLTRRKLGFGPPALAEFHVIVEARDLKQLEDAFQRVATREPAIEKLHAPVYSAVKDLTTALYRDYPDPVRTVT